MNDERYVLAMLVREMIARGTKYSEEKGLSLYWTAEDICLLIEQLRAEAVLGKEDEE